MEMGDVDQSEADKLDPDLWDQNDDENNEFGEGSEGLFFRFWKIHSQLNHLIC